MIQFEKPGFEKPGFDTALSLLAPEREKNHPPGAKRDLLFARRSSGLVFYLQKGRARVTVVSHPGKKLPSRFSPQTILWEKRRSRNRRAAHGNSHGITGCTTLRIGREEMIRVMHAEHSFSDAL